ncbi:MAG TPA: DUF4389 domain-containing protein [Gaiellaceae bacterium]|nr:DUF4389 domain-containing protein [Gaiellaceae bacterium]
MSGGRIALLVLGCVLALIALASVAGGAFLGWAHLTYRNDDGFYATRHEPFRTDGYAIRSDDLDLGTEGPDWLFEEGRLGTIRIDGENVEPGKRLFLGIGPADDVERYLAGADYDVVTDLEVDPFRVEYRNETGSARPDPPSEQTFWAASGLDRIEWKVDEGRWEAVAMNPDGSRGVVAEISVGAKTNLIIWGALGALGFGLAIGALSALLIWLAVRDRAVPAGVPAAAAAEGVVAPVTTEEAVPPSAVYPLQIVGTLDTGPSRWLWLVKWLLLIPHFIVLAFLWAAYFVVTVIAFFGILFTERYPRSLFDFNVGILRWTWRVVWYGYGGLATDRYPPFTLGDADYPARLDVPYPERLSRGLVLVKWWLLAIPHYIVTAFFLGGGWWWWWHWNAPGLILVLTFFAGVVLLFRNRYPESLYGLILGMDRWVARVVVYTTLMRDEYPPFRLDR